eukprot:TRINITY_DN194_c0_g1_i4.p1 TRINITY_DN194_c0_g1~~TRINITY_DN194_c0_g1_i4.p1  ORF type:complete len:656 (-),score=256.11 TRINITY_DN194_c0_g1_i4:30-1997(-)
MGWIRINELDGGVWTDGWYLGDILKSSIDHGFNRVDPITEDEPHYPSTEDELNGWYIRIYDIHSRQKDIELCDINDFSMLRIHPSLRDGSIDDWIVKPVSKKANECRLQGVCSTCEDTLRYPCPLLPSIVDLKLEISSTIDEMSQHTSQVERWKESLLERCHQIQEDRLQELSKHKECSDIDSTEESDDMDSNSESNDNDNVNKDFNMKDFVDEIFTKNNSESNIDDNIDNNNNIKDSVDDDDDNNNDNNHQMEDAEFYKRVEKFLAIHRREREEPKEKEEIVLDDEETENSDGDDEVELKKLLFSGESISSDLPEFESQPQPQYNNKQLGILLDQILGMNPGNIFDYEEPSSSYLEERFRCTDEQAQFLNDNQQELMENGTILRSVDTSSIVESSNKDSNTTTSKPSNETSSSSSEKISIKKFGKVPKSSFSVDESDGENSSVQSPLKSSNNEEFFGLDHLPQFQKLKKDITNIGDMLLNKNKKDITAGQSDGSIPGEDSVNLDKPTAVFLSAAELSVEARDACSALVLQGVTAGAAATQSTSSTSGTDDNEVENVSEDLKEAVNAWSSLNADTILDMACKGENQHLVDAIRASGLQHRNDEDIDDAENENESLTTTENNDDNITTKTKASDSESGSLINDPLLTELMNSHVSI